jgi:hypothetical protein
MTGVLLRCPSRFSAGLGHRAARRPDDVLTLFPIELYHEFFPVALEQFVHRRMPIFEAFDRWLDRPVSVLK